MSDIEIDTSLDPRGLVRRQPATSPTLITDLTVKLTINSDARDPFDEAEQLMELKGRLHELASVTIVGIERTTR